MKLVSSILSTWNVIQKLFFFFFFGLKDFHNLFSSCRTHGIFHLADPTGVSIIRNCQERGFHPHEQPPDGSPIYEHCSHVYMNPNLKFDVIDLRNS